jgi:probable F420-dependent oxidoreductase
MKVDGKLGAWQAGAVIDEARRQEKAGYDGLWSSESAHDPFLPLVLAAEHTEQAELGTAIAVAFARSPMQLAYTAHDLQAYSGGRFVLGLGSQVKPHIERRFAMPWSHPAPRMREFIMALRAIWAAWNDGTKLSFRGDFYAHTLMTPFFSPPPAPGGPPRVFLAAVGEAMTAVAGEAADGLLAHPFSTERYLREVTVPALGRGLAAAGRSRADAEVSLMLMIATGRTEEELAGAVAGTRQQIAFYGSTRAYRGVLALHGWTALGDELNALSRSSREDKWEAMGGLIDDEVLATFAVVAEPAAVAAEIGQRFGGLIDRVSFYAPYEIGAEVWDPILRDLKARARSDGCALGGAMKVLAPELVVTADGRSARTRRSVSRTSPRRAASSPGPARAKEHRRQLISSRLQEQVLRDAGPEQAEFVPFRVGEHMPRFLAALPDVSELRPCSKDALELGVLVAVGGVEIEVQAQLAVLGLLGPAQHQSGLKAAESLRRADLDIVALCPQHHKAQCIAPEPGKLLWLTAIQHQLCNTTGHASPLPQRHHTAPRTQSGLFWLVTMACGLLLSGLVFEAGVAAARPLKHQRRR